MGISAEILAYHALQNRLMADVRTTPRQKFKKAIEIMAAEYPCSKIDLVWSNRKQVYKALKAEGWNWSNTSSHRFSYWSGIPF